MPRFLQVIFASISFGTRFHGPVKPADRGLFAAALALQPIAGFFIGAAAAVLPVFIAANFRGLQGVMLFASGIYLFLLEWLARFDNLQEFDAACRMLAGADIPPDKRISRRSQPGSSPCTAMLVGLKLLLLYLIFMRTALFGDCMMLAIMLVSVPVFGRIAMLFSYPSRSPLSPAGGRVVKSAWVLFMMVLTILALGLLRMYGGDFFSFRSMKLTMSGFRSGGGNGGGVPPFIAVVSLGIQDAVSLLASGFLTVLYWNTEASKKLRESPTPFFAGAVCETAELAAMIVFLILADDLIF